MRRVFISVFFLGTFCSAQTSTAQQMLPEREPSLADQAQAAKKPPAEKAKVVVDNDTLEHKNRGSIPDLGSPDLEVNTVVDKIVQYRDSHPKDDAKQVINGWFLDQKSRIEQLNQQEKLYFEFSNRSAAPGAAYEVWSHASVAENYRRGSENRTLDDLWKLRDLLRGQYGKVHDRSLQRGIPKEWIPKEPGEE